MANEVQNCGGGFDVTESNAFFDDARARLNALAQRQDSMMSFMLGDRSRLDDINTPLIGCDDFQLPKFEKHGKPYLIDNPEHPIETDRGLEFPYWVEAEFRERGIVLNVAGPGESKDAGIQAATKAFVARLIS